MELCLHSWRWIIQSREQSQVNDQSQTNCLPSYQFIVEQLSTKRSVGFLLGDMKDRQQSGLGLRIARNGQWHFFLVVCFLSPQYWYHARQLFRLASRFAYGFQWPVSTSLLNLGSDNPKLVGGISCRFWARYQTWNVFVDNRLEQIYLQLFATCLRVPMHILTSSHI